MVNIILSICLYTAETLHTTGDLVQDLSNTAQDDSFTKNRFTKLGT